MARFRATVRGTWGKATRLGTPKNGLTATVNGSNIGIRVVAQVRDGEDILTVFLTGGSNAQCPEKWIGVYHLDGMIPEKVA